MTAKDELMLTLNSAHALPHYDVRELRRLPAVRCRNCCFQINLSSLPSNSRASYPALFQPLPALAMQRCYPTAHPVPCTAGTS